MNARGICAKVYLDLEQPLTPGVSHLAYSAAIWGWDN